MILGCVALALSQTACVHSRDCVDRVYWVNRTSHDLRVTIFATESEWQFALSKGDSMLIWEEYYSVSVYPKWREPQYDRPSHETPMRNICNRGRIDSLEIVDVHDNSQLLHYTSNDYYHPLCDFRNYNITDDNGYCFLITDALCAAMRGECPCGKRDESVELEPTAGKISRSPWYGLWYFCHGAKFYLLSELAVEYQIEDLEILVSGSGHVVVLPNSQVVECLDDYHIELGK